MDKYFCTRISAVGNAYTGKRAIWVAALFAEMGRLQEASALSSLSTPSTCPHYYSGRDALTWCNHVSEQATDHNLYFRSATTVLWPLHKGHLSTVKNAKCNVLCITHSMQNAKCQMEVASNAQCTLQNTRYTAWYIQCTMLPMLHFFLQSQLGNFTFLLNLIRCSLYCCKVEILYCAQNVRCPVMSSKAWDR